MLFRSLVVLSLSLSLAVTAATQDLSGRYVTDASGTRLVLDLAHGGDTVTGALSGLGFPVQVQAQVTGSSIEGQLSSPMGTSWLQGSLQGSALQLTVIDAGPYGQPDPSTAQRFVFQRERSSTSGGGALGGQLGGGPTASQPPSARSTGPTAPTAPAATGKRLDPGWGFSFATPEGWISQSNPQAVLLGSNTEKGLIMVTSHAYANLDQLRAVAMEGLYEEGVMLAPVGSPQTWGSNGVAIELQGTAQATPARGFAIGLLSPTGGGPTIITLVEAASWGPAYRDRVASIASSVQFSRSANSPATQQWKQKLSGMCLAYMKSDYDTGPSYGGYSTGSGWSDTRTYYLHQDGSFEGSETYDASFDTGGGFGSIDGGGGSSRGRWDVVSVGARVFLKATFPDGSVEQYELTTDESGKTYVDGSRWFVVSFQECNDL